MSLATSTHIRSAFGPVRGGGSSTNTSLTMSPVRRSRRSIAVGMGKSSGRASCWASASSSPQLLAGGRLLDLRRVSFGHGFVGGEALVGHGRRLRRVAGRVVRWRHARSWALSPSSRSMSRRLREQPGAGGGHLDHLRASRSGPAGRPGSPTSRSRRTGPGAPTEPHRSMLRHPSWPRDTTTYLARTARRPAGSAASKPS